LFSQEISNDGNKTIISTSRSILLIDDYFNYEIYDDSINKTESTYLIKDLNLKSIKIDDENYLISNNSGKVFLMDSLNNFKRIDNSISNKNQINSFIFNYNDTIYKFGGYGYWSNKNYITFFDKSTGQWEILKNNSLIFPDGISESISTIYNDKLYLIGGKKLNPNNYLLQKNKKNWVFNFTKFDWNELPTINYNIENVKNWGSFENFIFLVDDKNLILFDLKNNVIKSKPITSIFDKIVSIEKCQILFVNGDIIFLTNDNDNSLNLNRVNLLEIFDSFHEMNLFKFKFYVFYIVFIVLILFVFILFKSKKETKSHYDFNDFEIRFLNLLISSQNVSSSEFIIVLKEVYSNHNDDHLTRIKNEIITNLNFKLKYILKVDIDVITKCKSTFDRRIIEFSLNEKYKISCSKLVIEY
jgi:hypothetical protein